MMFDAGEQAILASDGGRMWNEPILHFSPGHCERTIPLHTRHSRAFGVAPAGTPGQYLTDRPLACIWESRGGSHGPPRVYLKEMQERLASMSYI